jgi:hypothetical protein
MHRQTAATHGMPSSTACRRSFPSRFKRCRDGENARERSEASHANGASRRSGSRESV